MTSENKEISSINSKKIVITGGTSGIGKALAIKLAALKARLVIVGKDKKRLQTVVSELKDKCEIYGNSVDLNSSREIKELFEKVDEKLGGIDILVNNAGVGGGKFIDGSENDWDELLNINLRSYILCTKLAVDRMKPKKQGHIVFTGSMSANTRDSGSDIYNVTKAGVQAFAESVRKTLNPWGIKISLIEPGSTATSMQVEDLKTQEKKITEGYFLKPENVADAIIYSITQPKNVNVIEVKIKPLHQYI